MFPVYKLRSILDAITCVLFNQLLCILVENESDVAAFKDFTPSEDDGQASPSGADTAAPSTATSQSYPEHVLGKYLL